MWFLVKTFEILQASDISSSVEKFLMLTSLILNMDLKYPRFILTILWIVSQLDSIIIQINGREKLKSYFLRLFSKSEVKILIQIMFRIKLNCKFYVTLFINSKQIKFIGSSYLKVW